METQTLVWQQALPEACCRAVQADAAALAECPNYWVPRAVVEGREPALAAAEQVVQQLYRRLVAARLAPHGDAFLGAELWCQIYEKGRGLGFHFDKDEHAMKEEQRMANPIFSSVYYVTGGSAAAGEGEEAAGRQAPTVLIDQWYNHAQGRIEPEHPAWTALVFPRTNQYCLFGGCQAHGVLEAMPQEPGAGERPPRVVFLVNWWAEHPKAIVRATAEDVAAGRLAPATPDLDLAAAACSGCCSNGGSGGSEAADGGSGGSGGGKQGEAAEPRLIEFVSLQAPQLEAEDILPVDALLEEHGVRLAGPGATDAVTIKHPGLTLFPLDEEQVDPAGPALQVMAAFCIQEDSSSEEESEEEA